MRLAGLGSDLAYKLVMPAVCPVMSCRPSETPLLVLSLSSFWNKCIQPWGVLVVSSLLADAAMRRLPEAAGAGPELYPLPHT